MRYSPQNYAQALVELLREAKGDGEAKIAKEFADLVEKNGDAGKIDLILAEVEKSLAKAEGKEIYEIEFARAPDKDLIRKLASSFAKNSLIRTKITPALVAGTRITRNGSQELDMSLTGRLKKVFR